MQQINANSKKVPSVVNKYSTALVSSDMIISLQKFCKVVKKIGEHIILYII